MSNQENNLAAIASAQQAMEKTLMDWCSINSSTYNIDGLAKMLEALKSGFAILPGKQEIITLPNQVEYDREGHSVELKLGNALRVTNRPEAPIQILFSGHMDTVYGTDHPFQACKKIDPNTLNGPAVADMKGGLLVMLTALDVFEKSLYAEKIGWTILISPDEEIGSPASGDILKMLAPNYHLGLIYESSLPDGQLIRCRKGSGIYTLIAHGRAAHAGRDPGKGRNAILFLSKFLLGLEALSTEFPGTTINIGTIHGGTVVNIVPDKATAKINVRINENSSLQAFKKSLNSLIYEANKQEGFNLEIHGDITRTAKEITPSIEHLFHSFKCCADDLGINLDWRDTGGVCDGNVLAEAGLPNIDNLGVRGDNIHSDQEYVLLDSLVERAQLSYLFLEKLASGEITLPQKLFKTQ